jgi:hypothetical protein
MPQTTYVDPVLRQGQLYDDSAHQIDSWIAEGDIRCGLLVARGTEPERQAAPLPVLPVADVDAIKTTFNSAAAAQTFAGAADLDGAIGIDSITPARSVTVSFDASADWNSPSLPGIRITVYGHDADGNTNFNIIFHQNGIGAETVATAQAFSKVTRIDFEESVGAGGTATIGVSNDVVELGRLDYPGIALYDPLREPNTAVAEIDDEEQFNVLRNGRIVCVPEHAVSPGDDVYVRILLAGADVRGQLTGQDGAGTPGTYAHLTSAHWITTTAADGLGAIELGGR